MNRSGRWDSAHGACLSGIQHAAPLLSSRAMPHRDVASIPLGAWVTVSKRSLPGRLARQDAADLRPAIRSLSLHQPRPSEPGTRLGNFKILVNTGTSSIRSLKRARYVDSTIPSLPSQSSFALFLTRERQEKEAVNG